MKANLTTILLIAATAMIAVPTASANPCTWCRVSHSSGYCAPLCNRRLVQKTKLPLIPSWDEEDDEEDDESVGSMGCMGRKRCGDELDDEDSQGWNPDFRIDTATYKAGDNGFNRRLRRSTPERLRRSCSTCLMIVGQFWKHGQCRYECKNEPRQWASMDDLWALYDRCKASPMADECF